MANFNLGDMSAYERMLYGNVEDDPDLEAELLALQNEIDDEDDDASPSKKNLQRGNRSNAARSSNNPMVDIDRLARQVSEEINVDDDDNDESVDDDPELLAELSSMVSEFTPKPAKQSANPPAAKSQQLAGDSQRDLIVLIEDRLSNYQEAQKAAKEAGDAAKLRRLERGTATLQDQLKAVRSGKLVERSEVPPPVTVSTSSTVANSESKFSHIQSVPQLPKESTPAVITQSSSSVLVPQVNELDNPTKTKTPPRVDEPSEPIKTTSLDAREKTKTTPPVKNEEEDSIHAMLCQRRDEFRRAALDAKQNGQKDSALEYFKTCKQFDKVIEAYEHGQDVDLTGMPTLSSLVQRPAASSPPKATSSTVASDPKDEIDESVFDEKAAAAAFKAPPAPSSVLEALQQRLEKYKSAAEEAQREGNTSKARRMGRIQKQYEDAIKAHRAGKPVDFEELPTPPGFAPIPVSTSPVRTVPAAAGTRAISEKPQSHLDPQPPAKTHRRPSPSGAAAPPAKMSKQEQELKFLVERRQQFKAAALAAKKRGDLASAKQLLRQALGFDQMIDACKNGLRVDIASTPTPPQMKTSAAVGRPAIATSSAALDAELPVTAVSTEGGILAKAGYEEIFSTLEQDLIHQIQICDRNREFYLNTGDVAKVTGFEKIVSSLKKDLTTLRNCFKHGDQPPRFHYETRVFPTIQCFPELGTDDLELSIVRGIQLKLPSGYEPKDAEIFVKYDLGYPKETPQTGKTAKVRGSNSPTFDFTGTLRINAKSRQFLHMIKRIGIRFEVYQKGGFLRSDILLGTAEAKLLPLETQPSIHQSLDIIENRKPVGGKLEVKIRIREPLVQKQAEEVKEKWLVIDQFTVPSSASALVANRAAASAAFGSRQLGAPRTK